MIHKNSWYKHIKDNDVYVLLSDYALQMLLLKRSHIR